MYALMRWYGYYSAVKARRKWRDAGAIIRPVGVIFPRLLDAAVLQHYRSMWSFYVALLC